MQASTDANYTLDNSSGSMVMDLNSGSLVVNADFSSASGWSNATLRLHNSARIYFNSAQTLGDLELHNFSSAAIALGSTAASGNLLESSGLSIDRYSKLDLGDNSLILNYAPSQEAADKSLIYGLLASGFNGGAWNGTGIYSSAAAADSGHVTALGFGDNQDLGKTSFDGVTLPDQNQILVRYTINGDCNLDGVVSGGADGALFSKGLNGQGTGWDFGDFNYDGSTTEPADLDLFQPSGTSLTSSQYTPGLQIQAPSFTATQYAPWSGVIATFTDSTGRTSYSATDYTATIEGNNGFFGNVQITQPTAGSNYFCVNAQTSMLSGGPFTIQIAYADGGPYVGAPSSMNGMITTLQLPTGSVPSTDATYTVSGSSGAVNLSITAGTIAFNSNVAGGGNYWQNVTINASGSAHLIFNSAQTLGALNLSDTATVTVSQGSGGTAGNVLQLNSLSVGSAATLDPGDNSIILYYTPSDQSSDLAMVHSLLTSGYAGGNWNGTGIDSSAAASDSARLTAVGYLDNNNWGYSQFQGVNLADFNQILIKYTIYGDADLDGRLMAPDIDGFISGRDGFGTGWENGDFNYDGVTNNVDLGIFENEEQYLASTGQYKPTFQLSPLTVQPYWNAPFIGDIATFTDTLNPGLPASDYTAQVYWGTGDIYTAQVYASGGSGSFRINAYSPLLTTANTTMMIVVQYAPGSGYQGEMAIVQEPIYVFQLPPGVHASADAVFTMGGSSFGASLDLTAGSLTFDTNVSQDSNYYQNFNFAISGTAHAYFNAPETFSGLQISDNAVVSVSKGSGGATGNLLNVQTLSIDPNATLDLSDNALIDWYSFSNESAASAQMSGWLQSGYNGGAWDGPGIDSSVAAADLTHATALGWMDNGFNYAAVGTAPIDPSVSSFEGVSLPTKDQFLVRFTYKGDANLNGQVDSTDDGLLDMGLNHQGNGWVYGDFDYDGAVTSADTNAWTANYSLSITSDNYTPAFQPTGIVINPIEGISFSGDIATFTDLLNPLNTDPSIYQAEVNWGDGGFQTAQVTATSTPGSFRINAESPALTNPNAVMAVTIKYADMNDPSPTYQGRPAAVSEPILFAPGAPTDVTVDGATDTEVDLSWTAPNGPMSVSLYTIYRDGVPVGKTTATAYADTGLEPGTAFTYTVSAQSAQGASSQSGAVTASTTNVENIQPPAPPSSLATTVSQYNYVTLNWTNSASNAAQLDYEITRNGVQITTTSAGATTYTDYDTNPYSVYTYSIAAFDPSQSVLSSPASAVVTTGADTLHPGTPPSFTVDAVSSSQVVLSWTQPADNVGVTEYVLSRSGETVNLTSSQTTYTDTVAPGGLYSYSLYAKDGSGNYSIYPASVLVNLSSSSSPIDQSPNQYVPNQYVNYFYNTLVKSFRQLNAYAGYPVSSYSQQRWFDPSGWGADTNITTLPGYTGGSQFGAAPNVFAYDHNGNGSYDAGESVWIGSSTFSSANCILISGPSLPDGTPANANSEFAYVDSDKSGDASEGELISTTQNGQTVPTDLRNLEGITGQLAYYDVDAVGHWTPDDPIWYDQNNNSEWDTGEQVIYQPPTPVTLNAHQWGKKDGLNFYDLGSKGTWQQGDPVWADSSASFRQDFAAFYGDVDSLIPNYILSGDANKVNETAMTLASALGKSDWTKVPATTTPDGVALSYVAGAPDVNSAIFPVQFQELHDVLSQLTTLPGIHFDQATSDAFNNLATTVIGYDFALDHGKYDGSILSDLENALARGNTQPGALEIAGTVDYDVYELENHIADGILQAGSWKEYWLYVTINYPNEPAAPKGTTDYNQVISTLNTNLEGIESNGMWESPNFPAVPTSSVLDASGYSYLANTATFPYYPAFPADWNEGLTGSSVLGNYAVNNDLGVGISIGRVNFGDNGSEGGQSGTLEWGGYQVQYTMPSSFNRMGGDPLGNLLVVSSLPGLGNGWTWGGTYTTFSIDAATVKGILLPIYPTTSDVDTSTSQGYDRPNPNATGYGVLPEPGFPVTFEYELHEYATPLLPSTSWDWGIQLGLAIIVPGITVYGEVPPSTYSFTAPSWVYQSLPSILNPPTDPIALQSQMNEFNVVQDTNLDGIVQVDHDQTSFGNDTGSMNFEMERNMPQVYIPLNTDGTDGSSAPQLPIHAYLSQGGFGSSQDSVGTLLDQDGWNYSGANENGEPFAYSLDTSVRNGAVIIDSENHLKRVEVIRPQGNAVLFDFPWDRTTQQFSAVGHPLGIDSGRLYVLRDLTPDINSDLSYKLLFPSGIVQTFDQNTGHLLSVSDTSSGLSASLYSSYGGAIPNASASTLPVTSSSTLFKDGVIFTTPRYDIDVNWAGGVISTVNYASNAASSSATIITTVNYDNNNIMMTGLDKAVTDGSMPPASYSAEEDASVDVSGASDGFKITEDDGSGNGSVVFVRSDNSTDHTVTITKSVEGANDTPSDEVDGTLSETGTFNSDGLITIDSTTLSTSAGTSTAETDYRYQTDSGYYINGAPKWGKITDVTNPDGSWVNYAYDPQTGWVTDQYTPYKSSLDGNTSGSVHAVYDYNAADSGNGDSADPNSLVALPRKTTTSIGTTVIGVLFARYQAISNGLQEISRRGSSASATWLNAALSSTTTLTGYDSYTLIGPLGTTTHTGTGLSSSTTQKAIGGAQLSSENTTTNAFGGLTGSNTSTASGIGQGPVKITPGSGGTPDPFGRTTSVTVNSTNTNIPHALTTSYSNYGWLGPQSVSDPTGQNTTYTYTPTGQVATATIYFGGQHSVTTTYKYDAAGNVIETQQSGTYNGQSLTTTTYASYDVLGRLLSSTDALGRKTTYNYQLNQQGILVTTTLPDPNTVVQEFQQYSLDGTLLSTTGSAVADPSGGDEGVITSTVNNAPGNVTIPAGSTWTETYTNGGEDWTKVYTNLLGQQFYTQHSGPNGTVVTTYTNYDGNGRPVTFQDVDGSVTHTDYNPYDGSELDTWVDTNGNGVYNAGVDSKTINSYTSSGADTDWVGNAQTDISASGNQQTVTQSKDSGLDTQTINDGLTTSTHTDFTGSDGTVTLTTNNPDGTKSVDNYSEGLLTSEVQEGTDGSTITSVSYGYDALRRNISVQDWEQNPTTFQLRDDGSVEQMTLPDGRIEKVNTQDTNTQLPIDVTRLDGQHVTQAINSTGQTTSQSGAGVTPATYGYDPVTAELSSLTIYPSGSSSDTTGQETTGFTYDHATGLLSGKTYADGSADSFTYNYKLQLASEALRGDFASFTYNKAGLQTGATYTGGGTGTTIYDTLGTPDDLGRSHVMTELTTTADGQSTSTSDVLSYNPQGKVASETQASGANVHYDYNADSSIKDMKLYQNAQVISETDYAYDPISKRLQSITVTNGTNAPVTYTYTYKTNTNLIETVSTTSNTIKYTYEENTGRLQEINSTQSLQSQFDAQYTYTGNDQRLTENVLQENADTQAIDQRNWTFGYDTQDQLTNVSENGTTLYSYSYDGVGNRSDGANGFNGGFNTTNQSADFQYDVHGNITDDGQFTYTWDSKARLTSVQPDYPDAQSQKEVFTYDPENRRTQEDIFTWDAGNQVWVAASSLKFVYDGSQMVAELNGQNQLLQSYAWGPDGRLLSITDYSGSIPTNYQAVTDGSGSVVELLNSSTGLVAGSYQYDPWGNPLSATGPAANVSPFRWQGEFYDASFGGYYMGAREGSARLHIFLSPDPSGEASDPNLYRMVGNDPINNLDPDGLEAKRSSIGGSETTNFLSTKDVITLPNGDRQITYRLLLSQETIASLGVGAPGYYGHSTTELASVQHVFSGPQAAQAEAMADRFVATKVDSLNQMDVAQARVDNMKSNFGLIPFFSAIDNYQQGKPWKLDAVLSVLAVMPTERVVESTVSAVEASGATVATEELSYFGNPMINLGPTNAGITGQLIDLGIPQGSVIALKDAVEVGESAGAAARAASSVPSVFDPRIGASIEQLASVPPGEFTDLLETSSGRVFPRSFTGGPSAQWINENRGLWQLTSDGADKIIRHVNPKFGMYYRSASDGTWWSVDKAGHGGSAFKVFTETATGLEWIGDADQFGDFIIGKHKGDVGKYIPFSETIVVK